MTQVGARPFGPLVLADLWQFNAAVLLDGMGHLQAGAVLIAPLPLARSVLEFFARTVHLLDPGIDPLRRGIRAPIEEAYSDSALLFDSYNR